MQRRILMLIQANGESLLSASDMFIKQWTYNPFFKIHHTNVVAYTADVTE